MAIIINTPNKLTTIYAIAGQRRRRRRVAVQHFTCVSRFMCAQIGHREAFAVRALLGCWQNIHQIEGGLRRFGGKCARRTNRAEMQKGRHTTTSEEQHIHIIIFADAEYIYYTIYI